ncbi:MAG: hypothetical protein Q8Q09_22165 [Deltaproteobacteria bacterium]|nr:hypothetical protein [Deltaproteobacteria bacterium]
MGKKNKNRGASNGGGPSLVTAAPAQSPPTPSPPSEAEVGQVEMVSSLSQSALDELALEPVPLPDVAPVGRSLVELLRDTEAARQRFEAARKQLETLQAKAQDAQRGADNARRKCEDIERRLDAREDELVQRNDRLEARERDADHGFLARRREILQPIESERAKLQQELADLLREANERRSALDQDFARQLDAQRQQWAKLADERRATAEAEQQRAERECTERCDALRRQTQDKIARDRQEADRALGVAQEQWRKDELALRDRERDLRIERTSLEADRDLLEEDLAGFDRRCELRAGVLLRDARDTIEMLRADLDRARSERERLQGALNEFGELRLRLGGREPQLILQQLDDLEAQLRTLRDTHANCPPPDWRSRLRELEQAVISHEDRERALRDECGQLRSKLTAREIAAVELETLRAQKETLETSRQLLRAEHDNLLAEVKSLTQQDHQRNPLSALIEIDAESDAESDRRAAPQPTPAPASLREFAAALRQRISTAIEGRPLYYSERDVRSLLGGMAMSPLLLLQGISGTGKTSLPVAAAVAMGGDYDVIEVQAGWRDRQDLLGYYNAFHKHYYASNFLRALYRAGTEAHRERVTLIVLDEINLSRVEQFFADFLSVMEKPPRDRLITLMSDAVPLPPRLLLDGRSLALPTNVWFVGTANHDETTTAFADKTYDRAHVMELPRHPAIAPAEASTPKRAEVSNTVLRGLFSDAIRSGSKEKNEARKWFSRSDGLAGILERECQITWGNRLERDIDQYVPVVCACGGTIGEAVDHLLQTKVLRRLRDRHDVRAKSLAAVSKFLEREWLDSTSLPERSLQLLERELRARGAEAD